MAFKDSLNKFISYFDTEQVSPSEDRPASEQEPVRRQPTPSVRQTAPRQEYSPRTAQAQRTERSQPSPGRPARTTADRQRPVQARPVEEGHPAQAARPRPQGNQEVASPKTTIVLKYPRQYEDAQEIVDLLIANECVLMDFQYMLDAQARRCLDFIDGASRVLAGSLQKVSGSMYLLTPLNVSVDLAEMAIVGHQAQETTYDFDMKRR